MGYARAVFRKLIDDSARLDHFMDNVLTLGFHFRHDAGEELADLVAELSALHPEYSG